MKNNQLEQLLTELTPQEAATVEGGAVFTLHSIYAQNPTAYNDPRVKFAGITLFKEMNMDKGEFKGELKKSKEFNSPSPLQVWDINPPEGANDILLGSGKLIDNTQSVEQATYTAGGYQLTYSVTVK